MARSPLVFTDEVWDLVAEEMDDEEYQDERRQHLQACLQKIESVDREILLKVHQTGVVTKGVARELGKSEQAFYKFIQRLRRRLRDCMSQAMATEE
jgi:RNA polymerase sigma-70 factor (ECF subfamily)